MKALHVFTLFTTAESFFNGQFRYLVEHGHQLDIVSQDDDVTDFCRNNNVRFHASNISRSISPITDIKTIFNLLKLIRREKYDAVFGHTPKGAMVSMIAAMLAGVKTRVYYRHGLIYTTSKGIKRHIFKLVEQITSSFATNIVNVSPSLSKLAVKDHLNSDKKQIVLGNGTCGGIDAKGLFNPKCVSQDEVNVIKNDLGINKEDFVIGFCGRLCKEKGVRELLDGFTLYKSSNPGISVKLLLVGGFDQRDILPDNYKRIIEMNNDIIHVGKVSQLELPKYYTLMDVFVFPSYREGFGMCVVEAASMGVPALVSRSHGCIDSIIEHQTGEYIDINAKSIAERLETMKNTSFRRKLGGNARQNVLKKFDHSVMWPKVLKVYSDLKDA